MLTLGNKTKRLIFEANTEGISKEKLRFFFRIYEGNISHGFEGKLTEDGNVEVIIPILNEIGFKIDPDGMYRGKLEVIGEDKFYIESWEDEIQFENPPKVKVSLESMTDECGCNVSAGATDIEEDITDDGGNNYPKKDAENYLGKEKIEPLSPDKNRDNFTSDLINNIRNRRREKYQESEIEGKTEPETVSSESTPSSNDLNSIISDILDDTSKDENKPPGKSIFGDMEIKENHVPKNKSKILLENSSKIKTKNSNNKGMTFLESVLGSITCQLPHSQEMRYKS